MGFFSPYAHSQEWEPYSTGNEDLIQYLEDFHDSVSKHTDFVSGEFKFRTDQGTDKRFSSTSPSSDLVPEEERINYAGLSFTRDEPVFFTSTPELLLEYDAYSGSANGTFYLRMDGEDWRDVAEDLSTRVLEMDEPQSYIERALKFLS